MTDLLDLKLTLRPDGSKSSAKYSSCEGAAIVVAVVVVVLVVADGLVTLCNER